MFNEYFEQLIEKSKNRRLKIFKKYNIVKQEQNQIVSNFVAYIETLKYELKTFIEIQKRDHLLNRLRSIINQIITKSTNIFNTRVSLIARTTRIENIRSANADENFNFFDERKLRSEKQRDNFLANDVSREFSDLTISSRFNDYKRNYVFFVQLFASDSKNATNSRKC